MRFIADLHIHSRFSRACSPALVLENIDAWCRIKGIDIVSTADFTHPRWFEDLKIKLEPIEQEGFYTIKKEFKPDVPPPIELSQKPTLFICGTEISCIYSQGQSKDGKNKVRRVHNCVHAPSIEVVEKINKELAARGCKLGSDGRPIIGMNSKDLLTLLLEIDQRNVLIPAHAWTPWFAIFGSKSGFDSIEECFGDLSKHIFAIETGLSSDPKMNWRVKELDNVALVSSSDAHSLPNLGREANMFEGEEKDLSYDSIMEGIKNAAPNRTEDSKIKLTGTIEFIPDEGRYHYDGHRDCKMRLHPSETKKHGGLCPKCKKPVTVGVLARVEELANQPENREPEAHPDYWGLVEVDKIIADSLGIKSRKSKAVDNLYWDLIAKAGSEMNVLLNLSLDELKNITDARIAEAIKRVRNGKVTIDPGYDGEYGVVKIFSDDEKLEAKQKTLF